MNEQRKTQSPEESLNWISYNLKRIADMLEKMNGIEKEPPRYEKREGSSHRSYDRPF